MNFFAELKRCNVFRVGIAWWNSCNMRVKFEQELGQVIQRERKAENDQI